VVGHKGGRKTKSMPRRGLYVVIDSETNAMAIHLLFNLDRWFL
jgi:hypothetical protein